MRFEESIYQQLTAARQTKARQVEEHFRTVRQDLLLLAHSKMVVEATRGFRTAVEQLDQAPLADGLRPKVEAWYEAHYMPDVRRLLGKDVPLADYMPVTPSGNYLQYHYIVANPHPPGRRDLLDDAHDGSDYSQVHAIHHPLLRTAAVTVGFDDFLIADARSGSVIYGTDKEVDFGTSLQRGPIVPPTSPPPSPAAPGRPTRRRPAWRTSRRTCRRTASRTPSWPHP